MPNIFIFHGTGGHPQENWFAWLKQELEKRGHKVEVPQLPSSHKPQLKDWLTTLEKLSLSQEDILIGHSLGVPTVLHLLERHSAKAAFLVAGFCSSLDERFNERIRNFVEEGFQWKKIKSNCQKFFIFHADNDPFVLLEKAKELEKHLQSLVILIPKGGHLNEDAGYFKFPLLLNKIGEEIKKK